jgi:hypothetical protein
VIRDLIVAAVAWALLIVAIVAVHHTATRNHRPKPPTRGNRNA